MCRELATVLLWVAATGPVRAQQLTRAPELLVGSALERPADAPAVRAVVDLELVIDLAGAVGEVTVVSVPQPPFDEAAVTTARRLRFRPAEVDGSPAAVRMRFRYVFEPPPPPPPPEPEPRPEAALAEVADPAGPEEEEGVVVRARRPRRAPGAQEVDTTTARSATGSMGDALAVARDLPGVARPSLGSGDLVVWGAAPSETAVLVDDVPIPRLYHVGGLRSVLHDGVVRGLELRPAAFAAQHGRVVGGVLRITTGEPRRAGAHGEVAADALDAAGLATVAGERASLAVGGRYGYLDRTVGTLAPEVEGQIPLSAWRNYVGAVRLSGGGGDTHLRVFGAVDDVERPLPGVDPDEDRSTHDRAAFHRIVVRHERDDGFALGACSVLTTKPSAGPSVEFKERRRRNTRRHSEPERRRNRRSGRCSAKRRHMHYRLLVWAGVDDASTEARLGRLPAETSRHEVRAGARGDVALEIAAHRVRVGIDAESRETGHRREGTLALPAREGDATVFGQSPSDRVNTDAWETELYAAAAYAHADLSLLDDRLLVSPGLRVEPVVLVGDAVVPAPGGGVPTGYSRFDVWLEPRLGVELRLPARVSLRAATGRFHQAPDGADRSPVFGGTGLGAAESWHAVTGVGWRPVARTSLELTGFYRRTEGLVTRAPDPQPAVAAALVDAGEGRSSGAQLTARGGPWRGLSGHLGYLLSRAERRAPGGAWRLFDHDRTHDLQAGATWATGGWTLGSRLRVTSGAPRTPVTGAWYDAANGRYEPQTGEVNSERLPTWFQLDLGAAYTWSAGPARLTASLEVLNITNRENAEEVVYAHDYATRSHLTGLPTTAILGVRAAL